MKTSDACPYCGYRTFRVPSPGTDLVCPVCVWEDLPVHEHQPHVYAVAIRRAQSSFLAIGACDPRYRPSVRAPEPHEQRSSGWQPIEQQIELQDVR
ncbi:MAG TPA: CPCC family cysteine-rich protein [Herpetosiphonaceae bacterium]